MCVNKTVDGLPEKLECVHLRSGTCLKTKMRKLPFENNRKRATNILELIRTDVNGPHNTTGYDGSRYFLSIIDDYSRLTNLYMINSKAEVHDFV